MAYQRETHADKFVLKFIDEVGKQRDRTYSTSSAVALAITEGHGSAGGAHPYGNSPQRAKGILLFFPNDVTYPSADVDKLILELSRVASDPPRIKSKFGGLTYSGRYSGDPEVVKAHKEARESVRKEVLDIFDAFFDGTIQNL